MFGFLVGVTNIVRLTNEPELAIMVSWNDFGGKGVQSKNFSSWSLAMSIACVSETGWKT